MSGKMKKLWYLSLISTLALGALTACGDSEPTSTTEIKEEVKEVNDDVEVVKDDVEEIRDLGGEVISLASWATVAEPEEKKSSQEEALWEYRHEMMEKYNYTFEEIGVTTWDGTLEYFSSNTLSGEPKEDIYRIHSAFISGALNSGLAYDLTTLDSIDLTDSKWSETAIEYMTKDSGVYGIAKDPRPAVGIFFNKRVFEEAGLDPDLLYDLQASGEWTWDKFVEISEHVARDTNNDGINDIYAIPYIGNIFEYAVMSNNGNYVAKDKNGMLYNDIMSPESFEAIQWTADYLAQDYELLTTKNMGHTQSFMDGQVAMLMAQESTCVSLSKNMTDDYGYVFFPKGPKAEQYMTTVNSPVWMIPSSYSKKEAENITFALDI
ncbi:hypothetical protein AN641_01590 [Candidatus Epulonipiscioides gigas]|nr:hypothetical protein AN641_01590 [Epulopiscium sp. SCG-C07WGA-EpuloA2]